MTILFSVLLACTTPPTTTEPAAAPVAAPQPLPPAQCADPAAVPTASPWLVAGTADMIAGLREFAVCSVVAGDFDQDGALDKAILEVDRTTRTSRLRLSLGSGKDIVAQAWPAVPEDVDGAVATIMSPKPAGAEVERSYITDEEQQTVRGRDAVEVCSSSDESSFDPSDLCYCSNFWFVEDGAAAKIMVCD